MARRPRLDLPGVPQHVIQRGNNRTVCFLDDLDRFTYLKYLLISARKTDCKIHAYVLMNNHIHFLVTGVNLGSVSIMMQSLGRRYVRYINTRHERTGTLWEGRFKSCLIDSERYLLTCYRYIELNPVRAGLVSDPKSYKWSSYLHHINQRDDPIVEDHEIYLGLGRSSDSRAQEYRQLCEQRIDSKNLDRIRFSANRGYALGSRDFIKKIEKKLKRKVLPGTPGRPPTI